MVVLNIWHGTRQDTVVMTSFTLNDTANTWIENTIFRGGFWVNSDFVPWHRVNSLEVDITNG